TQQQLDCRSAWRALNGWREHTVRRRVLHLATAPRADALAARNSRSIKRDLAVGRPSVESHPRTGRAPSLCGLTLATGGLSHEIHECAQLPRHHLSSDGAVEESKAIDGDSSNHLEATCGNQCTRIEL